MALGTLEPEHVTKILALTNDPTSVVNFAATCTQMCTLVRAVEKKIVFDYAQGIQLFIDTLPADHVGEQVQDDSIAHLVEASRKPEIVTRTYSLSDEKLVLPPVDFQSQIVTLRLTECYGRVLVYIGGYRVLLFDECLCELLGGTVDLMKMLRYLPVAEYMHIQVETEEGGLLTVGHVEQPIAMGCRWEVLQVYSSTFWLAPDLTTYTMNMYWDHPSVGIVIPMKEPLLHRISLSFEGQTFSAHARQWWTGTGLPKCYDLPIDFPTCYYVRLGKKVNFSLVDRCTVQLELQFKRPLVERMRVPICNIHTNYLVYSNGMMGLMYA